MDENKGVSWLTRPAITSNRGTHNQPFDTTISLKRKRSQDTWLSSPQWQAWKWSEKCEYCQGLSDDTWWLTLAKIRCWTVFVTMAFDPCQALQNTLSLSALSWEYSGGQYLISWIAFTNYHENRWILTIGSPVQIGCVRFNFNETGVFGPWLCGLCANKTALKSMRIIHGPRIQSSINNNDIQNGPTIMARNNKLGKVPTSTRARAALHCGRKWCLHWLTRNHCLRLLARLPGWTYDLCFRWISGFDWLELSLARSMGISRCW